MKLLPLKKQQKFLKKVEIFDDQKIDIDLNFFRELPINFNYRLLYRWYFHLQEFSKLVRKILRGEFK